MFPRLYVLLKKYNLLLLAPICLVSELQAREIYFRDLSLYVRPGFEAAWTDASEFDAGISSWTRVTGERPVETMRRLEPRPEEFTVAVPLSGELPEQPALYIEGIGHYFQIYFNGRLLKSNMPADGPLVLGRRLSFDIPRSEWDSRNLILFRIRGDVRLARTGLFVYSTDGIFNRDRVQGLVSEQPALAFDSVYVFVGLFFLVMFAVRRDVKESLYFGLFSTSIGIFFTTRTAGFQHVVPDYVWLVCFEQIALCAIPPTMLAFMESAIRRRITRLTKAFAALYGLLMLAILGDLFWIEASRQVWLASFPILLGLSALRLGRRLNREWHHAKNEKHIVGLLFYSVAGNLLIGITAIAVAFAYDLWSSGQWQSFANTSRYVAFFFVMGSGIRLVRNLLRMQVQVERLNRSLRSRVRELREAHDSLAKSQEKYRILVEESSDIIFTLDESGTFITSNRNMHRLLGYAENRLSSITIFDLMYRESTTSRERLLFEEKWRELLLSRQPLVQLMSFHSRYLSEPREMHVRFECISLRGRAEVLGRASDVLEDSLLSDLDKENARYVLGNSLSRAEELSQRLVRHVGRYTSAARVTGIRFGLREILVNAIEHGNLAISYEEKTREIEEGNYRDFISKRQTDPRYRDRRVQVTYRLNADGVTYIIEDDGEGFDHANMRSETRDDHESHGRGIQMTGEVFDLLRYNDRGNRVTLVACFSESYRNRIKGRDSRH